jgi:CheY-like chemotaxis protein
VSKAPKSIQADARKVKQIAYNLLSNAVKFTIDGGQVSLCVDRVPREEVGVASGSWTHRGFSPPSAKFDEFLRITVTDSGIGISPEGLEHLFKPFSQIDSGLSRKFEGTGLGLAMVKLLAELHGGAVAVESAVDEGSRFSVWLPLRTADSLHTPTKAQEAIRLAVRAERRSVPEGMRTALVVEDDYKSAELIRVQLEAEGFNVLHAASAELALELAAGQPLSLITLDIMLPNMDGWELLTRLKQLTDLRRIPVVIISIVADPTRGFSLGAAAVMQKPISRQELYESLSELGLLPVGEGKRLTVLVVDDDPKAVELMAVRVLSMSGIVIRAYSGREALDVAREEVPDVIILDLMMPEMSGFEVVAALNERPETARIPVIVITSKEITSEDRVRLNGYVAAIMNKNAFDAESLTSEVRRAMAGRRAIA